MNFQSHPREEPEINLIPFIDVLLVILIFLMLSTTYSKFTELQINLPVADVDTQQQHPKEVVVGITAEGQFSIDKQPISAKTVPELAAALQATKADPDAVLIIVADAATRHQAVVSVMEASRSAGLSRITFTSQSTRQAATP